jgi:hypothetical protein
VYKIGILATLLSATMLSAAHADMLTVTCCGGDNFTTWTNVPITYGLRGQGFDAGLGTYLNPNADGPTRSFWLNDTSGAPMHVVITDGDIGTAGYSYFQFPTSGMYQGEINGLIWHEQILVNGVPITSPDQIVGVGGQPYSITAVFDLTSSPFSTGGSGFLDFTVSPIPVTEPVASVPGPIAGAGIPGLVALGMLALARLRRRRSQ